MNEQDLELKLLAGKPIKVNNLGTLHFPTSGEIIEMDKSRYDQLVSVLLFDKDDHENLKNIDGTNLEFLLTYCYFHPEEQLSKDFIESLQLHFKDKVSISEEDGFFYFGDYQEKRILNEDNFKFIREVVRKANHIPPKEERKEEEFKPANSKAKEFFEMFKKNKNNAPKPKETINLHSIISGLAWKSNGMNLKEIFDLTLYQIYTAFQTTEQIDSYHYTMSGIYAGTVDGKKIKPEDIHWARVIKQK